MTVEERQKFAYEIRNTTPNKRKEMAIEFISKAKFLMEQELIIDNMYDQCDFKTMGMIEKGKYNKLITALNNVIDIIDEWER